MKVGVLALQGDFEAHLNKLREQGVDGVEIRTVADLAGADLAGADLAGADLAGTDSAGISGLIIPGGESTTLLKLTSPELKQQLAAMIRGGLPTLATCAGLIFLANRISNPAQESLGVLDAGVSRNGYGRQINSFIEPGLKLSAAGKAELGAALERTNSRSVKPPESFEGVFIRAPRITDVGAGVKVLVERNGEPVLIRERNVLAGTFHPELSPGITPVHQLFLGMVHARSEH